MNTYKEEKAKNGHIMKNLNETNNNINQPHTTIPTSKKQRKTLREYQDQQKQKQ